MASGLFLYNTMNITISPGNSKLGKVPNISLTPIASCSYDGRATKECSKKCYAMNCYRRFKGVQKAWSKNLGTYMYHPGGYEKEVTDYITKRKPEYFRWHVGGDIVDPDYYRMMIRIAKANPETRFLAYTKQYKILSKVKTKVPSNLHIVVSLWPGVPVAKSIIERFPLAWYLNTNLPDKRIPKSGVICPGSCVGCKLCWDMDPGQSIVFKHH